MLSFYRSRLFISLLLCTPLPGVAGWAVAQDAPAIEADGAVQYRIDVEQSWLRVLVYRGGLLRGLGHNHVVSHRNLTGSASMGPDLANASAFLELAVTDFIVDDANARQSEGDSFPGQISDKDIAATRRNMFSRKLLDIENYSTIKIKLSDIRGELPNVELDAEVSVKDYAALLTIPATIEVDDDGFTASGELIIRHGDIGLSPFKAALGTLRVRDEMTIKFQVRGEQYSDQPE